MASLTGANISSRERQFRAALDALAHTFAAVVHIHEYVSASSQSSAYRITVLRCDIASIGYNVPSFNSFEDAFLWFSKAVQGALPINNPTPAMQSDVKKAAAMLGKPKNIVGTGGVSPQASSEAQRAMTSNEKAQEWQDNVRWINKHRDARVRQIKRLRSVSEAFVDSAIQDTISEAEAAIDAIHKLRLGDPNFFAGE